MLQYVKEKKKSILNNKELIVMLYRDKDEFVETKIKDMKEKIKCKKFEDDYIRELVAIQKGELSVLSKYYSGNIAEGNWSLLSEDSLIKDLDENIFEPKKSELPDVKDIKSLREKDAEYTYVFIPSYYAVKTIILYYLENRLDAQRIYGLKNAVVRRDNKKSKKFYGGLPFILKYMKKIYTKKSSKYDSIKSDFADVIQELLDRKLGLEINNIKDDFINDIIDCINSSHCGDFILKKRIIDFEHEKRKYFCINYNDWLEKNGKSLNYTLVDEYTILMHRDVAKDWLHLKEGEIRKANEIIKNTPNFPRNIPPRNDPLEANIKGWFSQRVSHKDRVVYRKESSEKTVYIATVCDHYKDAAKRSKSKAAYK